MTCEAGNTGEGAAPAAPDPQATGSRAATMEELIRWCSEKIQEIDAQEPFAPTASYNAGYRVALVTLYWKLGQVIDDA